MSAAVPVFNIWRRGMPISQAFTLAANLNEHKDSLKDLWSGEMLTNINVFESPPRHGCTHNQNWNQYNMQNIRRMNAMTYGGTEKYVILKACLCILASKIKFQESRCMNTCQAYSSGKLSLINTSLLPPLETKPFSIYQDPIEDCIPNGIILRLAP